jgi:branched-chain amino acid transport system substrate-binding protein
MWGEVASGATLVLQDVCERYKIPNINVSGAPIITGRGLKCAFRPNPNLKQWHEVSFELFKELGIKSVALMNDSSAWGQANRKLFQMITSEHGLKMLADEVFEQGTIDLSTLINKVAAFRPDAVLGCPYFSDAILIAKQLKENNAYFPLFLGTSTGIGTTEFWKKVGPTGEYFMVSNHYHESIPIPENKKFVKSAKNKYGILDPGHAWGYIDIIVMADALERAASVTSEAIIKALRDTDMIGPCGKIKFGPDGQNHEFKGVTLQWLNGQQEVIAPKKLATAKAVYPMPTWKERK